MNLNDRMIRGSIRTSRRFALLTWRERDFFYGILSIGDPMGRFENDPAELRAALYAPMLHRVSENDVKELLARCHALGLIRLYTDGERGLGEVLNYGQNGLKKRTSKIPGFAADPPGETAALALASPSDPPPLPNKRKEGKGRETPAEPATPAPVISHVEWVAKLRAEFPAIDIDAQLYAADKNRKAQHKKLERDWFRIHWLGNISMTVNLAEIAAASAPVGRPEPEAWRLHLKDAHEGESWAESAAACLWTALPRNWQDKIAGEMQQAGGGR